MNLGFIAPGFLLLSIPVIGLLVYAYQNRGKAKRQFVSSTIIFKQLKYRPSIRKKVKLPWRFFYELLFLVLLLLAIAGFYWQNPGRYWQVIIDNSLSLSAVADSRSGKDILTLNIEQLKNDRQDRFKNLSGIKVCLTSPSYHCWSEDFQTWDEVSSKLEEIKIVPTNDLLESIINSQSLDPLVDLSVYSDYFSNSQQPSNLRLSTVRSAPLGNLAITDVVAKQHQTLSVELKSFASSPVQRKIRLHQLVNQNDTLVIERTQEVNFKIAPMEKTNVDFLISKATSAVIAEIGTDEINSSTDAIAFDNIYYQTISQQGEADVLLVSNQGISGTGLDFAFPGKISQVSPSEYQQLDQDQLKQTLIIFDNYIPQTFPKVNHLIIASNAEPGVLKTSLQKSIAITDWNKQSPLLRYLTPDNFEFKNVWVASLPNTFQPVIKSNKQTILASGFVNQVRSVYLGFPLLPIEKDRNQALAILSLNIFKWLSEESPQVIDHKQAGTVYQSEKQQIVAKQLKDLEYLSAGIILNQQAAGQSLIAKNFYSEEESNLQLLKSITLPEVVQSKGTLATTKNPNANLLIWIVLLLFLVSLFIWRSEKNRT